MLVAAEILGILDILVVTRFQPARPPLR